VRHLILEGSKGEEVNLTFEKNGKQHTFRKSFEGVLANLQRRLRRVPASAARARPAPPTRISRPSTTSSTATCPQSPCSECGGTRLRKEARHIRVGGKTIAEMTALTIREAHDFIKSLALSKRDWQVCLRIIREVTARLGFLISVGIDYLSLDRPAATLSGGETATHPTGHAEFGQRPAGRAVHPRRNPPSVFTSATMRACWKP